MQRYFPSDPTAETEPAACSLPRTSPGVPTGAVSTAESSQPWHCHTAAPGRGTRTWPFNSQFAPEASLVCTTQPPCCLWEHQSSSFNPSSHLCLWLLSSFQLVGPSLLFVQITIICHLCADGFLTTPVLEITFEGILVLSSPGPCKAQSC